MIIKRPRQAVLAPCGLPAQMVFRAYRPPSDLLSMVKIVRLLFSSSEQGAWYDPSDMSTLFQDSAGTVPVTAVEQPVGRMLDKSGRGNHATQATTTKRPVLSRRVNLLLATAALATQSITTIAASHRLAFSGAGSITLSGTASGVFGAGAHTIACTAGTLTLTVAGAVNDADFRLAADAHLPYQRVNTATDYDADPSKFPAYLRFDGVDDALQTGNIDFTSTDKMTVWAGVTALDMGRSSGAVNQLLYSNGDSFNGFGLRTPSSSGLISFSSSGNVGIAEPSSSFHGTAPTNLIMCGYGDQVAPLAVLRSNGVQRAVSNIAQGTTGGYGNRTMWLASHGGVSRFFNGRLYSLIVRGAQTPLSQIEATEAYIKQKMRLP